MRNSKERGGSKLLIHEHRFSVARRPTLLIAEDRRRYEGGDRERMGLTGEGRRV